MSNIKAEMDIVDLVRRALSGDRIMVVCKSQVDARDRCRAMWDRIGKDRRLTLRGFDRRIEVDQHYSRGEIEFGWVESSSGRRIDDADAVCMTVLDPGAKAEG
ncbi:hypothetical protein [Paenirhodobacter populi]|uniref:Uncharacterized protein n=1 Tax=Paenirhodobacter populi TaxID=2306993 RepID=A0A443JEB4_9RHOB|nr:hypothetical protein [Sinirhodobacter populi]RWR18810.1 hypothetical protein D2T30_15735 [Sinirhodobacter populi]